MEHKPTQEQNSSIRQQMIAAAQRDLPIAGIVKFIQQTNPQLANTIVADQEEFLKFVRGVYTYWLFRVDSTFSINYRPLEHVSLYGKDFRQQCNVPKHWKDEEELKNILQQEISKVNPLLNTSQEITIECNAAIQEVLSGAITKEIPSFKQVNFNYSQISNRGFTVEFTTENFAQVLKIYSEAFSSFVETKLEEKQKELTEQKSEVEQRLPHVWPCLFDYSTAKEDKHTLVDILSDYVNKAKHDPNAHKKLTANFLLQLIYQLNPASDKSSIQLAVITAPDFQQREILANLYKLLHVLDVFTKFSKDLDKIESSELVKDMITTIDMGLSGSEDWKERRKSISNLKMIITRKRSESVVSRLVSVNDKIKEFLTKLKRTASQELLTSFEEKSFELAMILLDLPMKKELEKLHHDDKIIHALKVINSLLNAKTPADYLKEGGVFDLITEGIDLSRKHGKNEASRNLELRLLALRNKICSEMLLSRSTGFTKEQVLPNLNKIVLYGIPNLTAVAVIRKFIGENDKVYPASIIQYYLNGIFKLGREINGQAIDVSELVYEHKDIMQTEIMELQKTDPSQFHTYAFLFNFHLNRYKESLESDQADKIVLIDSTLIDKNLIVEELVKCQPECKNFDLACSTLKIVSSKEKGIKADRDEKSIGVVTSPNRSSHFGSSHSPQTSNSGLSVNDLSKQEQGVPSLLSNQQSQDD